MKLILVCCLICRQLRNTPTTFGMMTLKAAFKTLCGSQDSEAIFSKLDQKDLVLPNKASLSSPALKNKRPRKNDNEGSAPAEGESGSELQPKNKRMTISRLVLEEDSQSTELSSSLNTSQEIIPAPPSTPAVLNQALPREKNSKYEDLLCRSLGAGWWSWLGLVLLLWWSNLHLNYLPPRLAQTARMWLGSGERQPSHLGQFWSPPCGLPGIARGHEDGRVGASYSLLLPFLAVFWVPWLLTRDLRVFTVLHFLWAFETWQKFSKYLLTSHTVLGSVEQWLECFHLARPSWPLTSLLKFCSPLCPLWVLPPGTLVCLLSLEHAVLFLFLLLYPCSLSFLMIGLSSLHHCLSESHPTFKGKRSTVCGPSTFMFHITESIHSSDY